MEINKPFFVVLIIRFIYAGYFLLTKVAFSVGMNTYVFVFYRQAAATVFLAPTAMFFQWRTAPPLSFTIFIRIFLLTLCGITVSLDIFGIALTYTTASLAAATSNTLPVITFFLAVLFRMEKVKPGTSPGIMKVSGVALCSAGAATIALYRGPFFKLLLHHHLIKSHHQQLEGHAIPSTQTWIKGVSLMLLSNITWALWLVLQGRVLKSYPSKFLLIALQCFLSTIQSFVVAVAFVRDPNEWKLGLDVKLVSIAYCGIVVTGIAFYLQTWVIEKKGPVYLAMTTPLILIFTTAASTLLFGEIISLGRKTAPPLSFIIFIKIFMLSLCGITMSLDIFGVALKYTTPSLAAATSNTLPAITFFLAVLFRMEKVKLWTSPGIMKVSGVALCLAGAATIALYRGPLLKLLLHHHLIKSHHQQLEGHAIPSTQTWIKGVSLMLLSNITWAMWLVLQGRVLKSYPSKLLLTTLQCFLSTIQSFFVVVAFVRDPNELKLGWNVKLISIAYCGIVVTGITFYLQAWVIEKRGPVYLAMATPLLLIFTTFASTFLFGEIISLGSVLGALLLVGGLYCVLWGKTKEEEMEKGICAAIVDTT